MDWLCPRVASTRARYQPSASGAEHRCPPQPSGPELMRDWLATLTVLGRGHETMLEALDDIERAIPSSLHVLRLSDDVPVRDRAAIEEALRWQRAVRGRQKAVHIMVESWLLHSLAEATGRSWEQVVQRLALEMEREIEENPPAPPR